MADIEKELLQAKHRLEKALPQATRMTLEQLEEFLWEAFKAVR